VRQHRLHIDAVEQRRELGTASKFPVEDRLHQRSQQQAVGRGDKMDGRSHHSSSHQRAIEEQLRQNIGVEALEA
jgi:hypothetical protein